MKQFFPLGRREKFVLPMLISYAALSFLPVWRNIEIGGVAVFGWLMAFLMIASPVLTLLVMARPINRSTSKPPADKRASGKHDKNEKD